MLPQVRPRSSAWAWLACFRAEPSARRGTQWDESAPPRSGLRSPLVRSPAPPHAPPARACGVSRAVTVFCVTGFFDGESREIPPGIATPN